MLYRLKVVPGRLCRDCFSIFRKPGPATRCYKCQEEYRKQYMRLYREKNKVKLRYLWRISKYRKRKSRYTHPLSIIKDENGNYRIKAALELQKYREKQILQKIKA